MFPTCLKVEHEKMLHLTAATKMAVSFLSHKLNSYELSLRNHLLFATVVIIYMNVLFPLWFQFSTDKRKFFKAACREMVIINFPAIWQKWNLTKLTSPWVCPFNICYQWYRLHYITGYVFQNPTLRHASFPDLSLNLFSSFSSLALVRPGRSPTQAFIIRACWNLLKEKN